MIHLLSLPMVARSGCVLVTIVPIHGIWTTEVAFSCQGAMSHGNHCLVF